jgi:rare lipoprotein A
MTRPALLRSRAAIAATGALSTFILAAAPGAAGAQIPGTTIVTMRVADHLLVYGQQADVRGRIVPAAAGRVVTLQLERAAGVWQTLAQAQTGGRGGFRLRAVMPASGAVRVVTDDAQARAAGAGAPPPAASYPARIAVAADVVPRRRHLNVLAGARAVLHGAIRPAAAGRRVLLQRRTRRGWTTLARSRTGPAGGFRLRKRLGSPLSALVRVRVAGGGGLVTSREGVGRLNVFRRALASWYGPGFYGGSLACGGRLGWGTLGVAHKTLPCGTPLTLRYGRRMVRVRVIDRGPYAGGREFDLTGATKQRLGFGGVGTVLVTR